MWVGLESYGVMEMRLWLWNYEVWDGFMVCVFCDIGLWSVGVGLWSVWLWGVS